MHARCHADETYLHNGTIGQYLAGNSRTAGAQCCGEESLAEALFACMGPPADRSIPQQRERPPRAADARVKDYIASVKIPGLGTSRSPIAAPITLEETEIESAATLVKWAHSAQARKDTQKQREGKIRPETLLRSKGRIATAVLKSAGGDREALGDEMLQDLVRYERQKVKDAKVEAKRKAVKAERSAAKKD
ncbi:hypothetical protein LTR53_001913 [Teratosphaeriaceae sp. CCFEE 6253]|nr:hypothetical protein LTR53_001913 [Teratosphaeriaceae sp. CCFEE 6253]